MEKTAKSAPAKTVEEYLQLVPKEMRTLLKELRQAIRSAAPQAEEVISYQVPTYKYKGPLVHFAAFKKHCSLIVVDKNILETFSTELQSYKTSGTTIHLTPDHPLPVNLVQKIVKIRMKENEERVVVKKMRTKGKSKK